MTGLAVPGAAFIRIDDEKCVPVDPQVEMVLRNYPT